MSNIPSTGREYQLDGFRDVLRFVTILSQKRFSQWENRHWMKRMTINF